MKVRTTGAAARHSARLAVIGCSTMTILTSVAVSACSGGTPSAASSSFSPAGTPTPTASASPSGTESHPASASPSPSPSPSGSPTPTPTPTATPTPSPSASPLPTAAPATGGGGTAGFQDGLLFALGGAAVLGGAGSIAYRRRVLRSR